MGSIPPGGWVSQFFFLRFNPRSCSDGNCILACARRASGFFVSGGGGPRHPSPSLLRGPIFDCFFFPSKSRLLYPFLPNLGRTEGVEKTQTGQMFGRRHVDYRRVGKRSPVHPRIVSTSSCVGLLSCKFPFCFCEAPQTLFPSDFPKLFPIFPWGLL